MAMIKFPSIKQFRNVVKYAQQNGMSRVDYTGTVKLHGTNASVSWNPSTGEFNAHGRNRTLSIEDDNYGFCKFAVENLFCTDLFHELFYKSSTYPIDGTQYTVFGEWAGEGIQRNVAVSKLPKSFYIFALRMSSVDGVNCWVDLPESIMDRSGVYLINKFPTYKLTVDFTNPAQIQNELVRLTTEVEECCPVGKSFGIDGIGEGIVWQPTDPNENSSRLWFKVKGEKHSVTKVKTLVEIDTEKVNSITEFVDATITENRLNQGLEYLKEMGLDIDITNMGAFIKWVTGDVFKEEMDRLEESGLNQKDVGKVLSMKIRDWFKNKLDELVGL